MTRTRKANVMGGSGELARGTWCTPKAWAERLGEFDLDPFSNPRSHIAATLTCMLERGGNALPADAAPGYYVSSGDDVVQWVRYAGASTRTFLQPPYELVREAIAHYGHTRFVALLRFDPSTRWFADLYRLAQLVAVPRERMDFEPPPGVAASSNPFPHAFFYARAEDAPAAVLRRCVAWRTR